MSRQAYCEIHRTSNFEDKNQEKKKMISWKKETKIFFNIQKSIIILPEK